MAGASSTGAGHLPRDLPNPGHLTFEFHLLILDLGLRRATPRLGLTPTHLAFGLTPSRFRFSTPSLAFATAGFTFPTAGLALAPTRVTHAASE